jgi:fido (protein-threonine AMPylation protein)
MARPRKKPHQLLAESLKVAKAVATDSIVKTELLSRAHKSRLESAGCLTKIISGWYLLTSPDGGGGSTAWYGGFWGFLKHYLNDRFGENEYCISAESSLSLHAGDTTIPKQIIVLTKKDSNTAIELLHGTSIFLRTDAKNFPSNKDVFNGVPIMDLTSALCRLTPSYFEKNPRNIEIVLKLSFLSVAEISRTLLKTQNMASAERIIGAYTVVKEETKAKQILDDLTAVGYKLNSINPFEKYNPQLSGSKFNSPYAGRIKLMWNVMREVILKVFPTDPGLYIDQSKTIDIILETYVKDAYHSLSIEGYHVTEELIEKIATGKWDPDSVGADKQQMDAMAMKGYSNSFDVVVESVRKILKGTSPGAVLEDDLQSWYRELFAPLFKANVLGQEKLAGYRNNQVYITNSKHVPPPRTALLDCMDVFFDLLKYEPSASVRAVLGHFIFVYIHPYMDGNGRIGRFILNLMLVSGGFNWTIIRVERRKEYMSALESASTEENIEPFAKFILEEMNHWKK